MFAGKFADDAVGGFIHAESFEVIAKVQACGFRCFRQATSISPGGLVWRRHRLLCSLIPWRRCGLGLCHRYRRAAGPRCVGSWKKTRRLVRKTVPRRERRSLRESHRTTSSIRLAHTTNCVRSATARRVPGVVQSPQAPRDPRYADAKRGFAGETLKQSNSFYGKR